MEKPQEDSEEEFFKMIDEMIEFKRVDMKDLNGHQRNCYNIPSIVSKYLCWSNPDNIWEYVEDRGYYNQKRERDQTQGKSVSNFFGMPTECKEMCFFQGPNFDENDLNTKDSKKEPFPKSKLNTEDSKKEPFPQSKLNTEDSEKEPFTKSKLNTEDSEKEPFTKSKLNTEDSVKVPFTKSKGDIKNRIIQKIKRKLSVSNKGDIKNRIIQKKKRKLSVSNKEDSDKEILQSKRRKILYRYKGRNSLGKKVVRIYERDIKKRSLRHTAEVDKPVENCLKKGSPTHTEEDHIPIENCLKKGSPTHTAEAHTPIEDYFLGVPEQVMSERFDVISDEEDPEEAARNKETVEAVRELLISYLSPENEEIFQNNNSGVQLVGSDQTTFSRIMYGGVAENVLYKWPDKNSSNVKNFTFGAKQVVVEEANRCGTEQQKFPQENNSGLQEENVQVYTDVSQSESFSQENNFGLQEENVQGVYTDVTQSESFLQDHPPYGFQQEYSQDGIYVFPPGYTQDDSSVFQQNISQEDIHIFPLGYTQASTSGFQQSYSQASTSGFPQSYSQVYPSEFQQGFSQESIFNDEEIMLKFVALNVKIENMIDINIFYSVDLEELFETAYKEYKEKHLDTNDNEEDFDQFVQSLLSYLLNDSGAVSSKNIAASDLLDFLLIYFHFFKQAIILNNTLSTQLFHQIIRYFKANVHRLHAILPFMFLILFREYRKLHITNLRKLFLTCKLFFKNKVDLGKTYQFKLLKIIHWCITGTYNCIGREDHILFRKNAAKFYAELLHEKPSLGLATSLDTFKNSLKDISNPIFIFACYGVMYTLQCLGFQAMQSVISGVFFNFKKILNCYLKPFSKLLVVDEAINKAEVVTTKKELKKSKLCNRNLSQSMDIKSVNYHNKSINYYRFYYGKNDKTIDISSFKIILESKGKIVKAQNHPNTDGLTQHQKCIILLRELFLNCSIHMFNIFIKKKFLDYSFVPKYIFECLTIKINDLHEFLEYFKDELKDKLEFPSHYQVLKTYCDSKSVHKFCDIETYI